MTLSKQSTASSLLVKRRRFKNRYIRRPRYVPRAQQAENMQTEVKRTPDDPEGGLQLVTYNYNPCCINGWNPVANCQLGPGNGSRIGKRIFIRYFKFKISLFNSTTNYIYEPIRVVIVADKKANPNQSPANPVSPYHPTGNRTPISYTGTSMEWNNIINTEDWVVYHDALYVPTADKPVCTIDKTIKIFKTFEYADT